MENSTLPFILTLKEVSGYLKVDEDIVLRELETGSLHGFKVGEKWRCSEEDILNYIRRERIGIDSAGSRQLSVKNPVQGGEMNIIETGPFDFNWPKKGGGSRPEHYDKGYEATKKVNDQEYIFKIGFGNRKSAGQVRRRVTIWLGNRAIVEFAGSNGHENDGLLAGIIRLKNGKQLTSQRIPDEYRNFRVERYNSIVQGHRASTGMAVIVYKDDFKSMLAHAIIRATWKGLL
jgi:excisionase family DNA binding protein